MAKVLFLVFMVVLCMVALAVYSSGEGDCFHANGEVLNTQNRRVLKDLDLKKMVLEEGEVQKNGMKSSVDHRGEEKKKKKANKMVDLGWELRLAPMGPDPLHHNGAPPKKPRTTP